MTPQNGPEIVVGVADCKLAQAPAVCLATYALGSCIAVVIYDWKVKVGGLLHVMLPESSLDPARAAANPFMYMDTGVPELFRRLQETGGSKHRARCCVAGGAMMMADSSHFEIGKRNYLSLKKVLWRLGVFIDREDVGGTESRSVRLDLETGRVDLRKGGGTQKVLVPAGINLIRKDGRNADLTR